MREFEISSPVSGEPHEVWATLTNFSRYGEWSQLVPVAEGSLVPGACLDLRLQGPGGLRMPFRPTVVATDPPREFVLEASAGHRSLIHLVHTFTLAGSAPKLFLQQRWEATGALVPLLWPLLRLAMARFDRLGEDLNARMSALARDAV